MTGGVHDHRLDGMLRECSREEIQIDSLRRHMRYLQRSHVQRFEHLEDLVAAGTLDGHHVAGLCDRTNAQIERFGCARGHNDVVGHAGRALTKDKPRNLTPEAEIASSVFVADRVVGKGGERDSNGSIQTIHREERCADDRGTEFKIFSAHLDRIHRGDVGHAHRDRAVHTKRESGCGALSLRRPAHVEP